MPGLSPVLLHFRWQLHSIGKHGGGGKPQLDLKPIKSPHPAKKGIALSGNSLPVIRRQRLVGEPNQSPTPVGEMAVCSSPDTVAKLQNCSPQPPIFVASVPLPRSPVSFSSGDEVPHIFTRTSRLRPGEFLVTCAKRLLQQYPPTSRHREFRAYKRFNPAACISGSMSSHRPPPALGQLAG